MKKAKLCVCGRSSSFPICDSSHTEEGWSCMVESSWATWGFCASNRYENIARKLASHYDGAYLLPKQELPVLERLIILVESSDISGVVEVYEEATVRYSIVFAVDQSSGLLKQKFPQAHIVDFSASPLHLFREIRDFLDEYTDTCSLPETIQQQRIRSAFFSHAVADEGFLSAPLGYLRNQFAADFFLCADSIQPSSDWYRAIEEALREQEVFIALLSSAFLKSHFCSFEIGMACALRKPMFLISIDGVAPPAFVQHLNMFNLQRIVQQKPWLDVEDALLDVLIQCLKEDI